MSTIRFQERPPKGSLNKLVQGDSWGNQRIEIEYRDLLEKGTDEQVIEFFAKYPLCAENINTEIWTSHTRWSKLSPLSLAIRYNREKIARLLVDRFHADVNFPPDAYYQTTDIPSRFIDQSPIFIAMCIKGYVDLANYLLCRGARINNYVVTYVMEEMMNQAQEDDDSQEAIALQMCIWLRNCLLRYPMLRTNELEDGAGRLSFWFQGILCNDVFYGMHHFIKLFYSLGMVPIINPRRVNAYSVPGIFSELTDLNYQAGRISQWSEKRMESYMEAMRLVYVRLPRHNIHIETTLDNWLRRICPKLKEASKARFTLRHKLTCDPETIKKVWREDRHDYHTFQHTMFALYSAKIVPRLGQASTVKILPTDILFRLSHMLGHGTLKLDVEVIPVCLLLAV